RPTNVAVLENSPRLMQPLSPTTRQRTPRPRHPVVDAQYRASQADCRAAGSRPKLSPLSPSPSFRDLSREFLGAETKRDYRAEALCFLILVSVSAWPIVSMMRALSLLK